MFKIMNFFITGLNHKTTPLDIRERFAFDYKKAFSILHGLLKHNIVKESFYLNTCNRAEFYAVSDKDIPNYSDIQNIFCKHAGVKPPLSSNAWNLKTGEEAVNHLFCVAASLDSMVVGETQILGQIKSAYLQAIKNKTTGPFLNHLIMHAITTAKRVRTETDISKGLVSVASVAVEMISRSLGTIANSTMLVIGAGETAALIVRQLKKYGAGRIVVVNRTFENAVALAQHAGGEAVPWQKISSALEEADVVISSTSSPAPIISNKTFSQVTAKPRVIIDLGTPRDVAPEIEKIDGVSLFDIDKLKNIAADGNNKRVTEAKKAKELIIEETGRFMIEVSRRKELSTIAILNGEFKLIQQRELNRIFKKIPGLTEKERKVITAGVNSIISNALKNPRNQFMDERNDNIKRLLWSDTILELFNLTPGKRALPGAQIKTPATK